MENWLGVELRHLSALAAIHEERSFRGAADRLGYVQSAVSQQLSQLEALVGARLVERTRGHAPPVQLTEAGLLLLEHASRILGQLDAAQADLRSLAADGAPTLRMGVEHSVAMRLVPPTLVRLTQRPLGVNVTIEEASSDRTHLERVECGELDAAVAELPLGDGPFECAEVLVDPCVLIVPAGDPLACATEPLELPALVAAPLVATSGWPMIDLIESHLRSAGLKPHFVLRVGVHATVQALVGSGVGAAILPRLAVNEADPRIAVIDVSHLLPSRRLALYWHEGRRHVAALSAFRDAILAAAHDIARGRAERALDAWPLAVVAS